MEEKPIKIFFFGDSICFGQGVSLHKGWVTRLANHIDKIACDYKKEILIVNSSVNGRTTRQALENMPYEVQSHKPDILIVQFGMNDCNYWETDLGNPRVSPHAFEANLEEIIARALSFGTHYIFLNTNHPSGKDETLLPHTTVTYEQNNKKYNDIIRKVAKKDEKQIILIDMEVAFKSHAHNRPDILKLLLSDKIHLSEAGHIIYYNTICPKLEKIIEKLINEKKSKMSI